MLKYLNWKTIHNYFRKQWLAAVGSPRAVITEAVFCNEQEMSHREYRTFDIPDSIWNSFNCMCCYKGCLPGSRSISRLGHWRNYFAFAKKEILPGGQILAKLCLVARNTPPCRQRWKRKHKYNCVNDQYWGGFQRTHRLRPDRLSDGHPQIRDCDLQTLNIVDYVGQRINQSGLDQALKSSAYLKSFPPKANNTSNCWIMWISRTFQQHTWNHSICHGE